MGTQMPRSPEEMTAEWLTSALTSGGALKGARVRDRRIEPIGAGAGLLGQVVRLHLQYDGEEPGAPKSVVAKLPTLDPGGREVCRVFQLYDREILFYEQVASSSSVGVPVVYYTSMDPAAGDYLLLIEDLCDLRMGDEVAGCSEAEAELVVRTLAEFHRGWWERPELASFDWMPAFNGPVQQIAEPAYNQAWQPFVDTFGALATERTLSMGEAMRSRIVRLLDTLAPAPVTIAHGDYRLDNLFFGDGTITAIDWQICSVGRGAFDLGYFLASCVEPEVRRAAEMRLVRMWHEIVSDGGKGYSWDEAFLDYRRAVLASHIYTVIAIGSLDAANERGLALFRAWLRRRGAAIEDLDATELMPA